MITRISIALIGFTALAWGQGTMSDWAANALLQSDQPETILSTLNQPVAGKPFSATATVQMVHTLEDGTRINRTTTTLMYRDAAGRRRTETDGIIDIADPVTAHAGLHLNSRTMSAVTRQETYIAPDWKPVSGYITPKPVSGGANVPHPAGTITAKKSQVKQNQQAATIELGVQTVNGVAARGLRTTLTIPAGAIGNDREFRVVKETWTSEDLGMLVKSINSDPRFGTSTFEMTNIVQAPPNPSLFEIRVPPGYELSHHEPVRVGGGVSGRQPNSHE